MTWIAATFSTVGYSQSKDGSTSLNRSYGKPIFVVVATLHKHHLNEELNYPLEKLWGTIARYSPDVICGEIADHALGQSLEGYFPPEATMLAQLAEESDMRFVATDWRGDIFEDRRANRTIDTKDQSVISELQDSLFQKFMESKEAFELYHSETFQSLVDSVHRSVITAGSDAADGFWYERNKRIVATCLDNLIAEDSLVVLAFGGDHLYILKKELEKRGYTVQVPDSAIHRSFSISPVVARWRRNLQALEELKHDPVALDSNYAERVRVTSRPESLRMFIDHYDTK